MPRTVIFLIRHGARYDFANKEEWQATCARLGHEAHDPPLSALGHSQAREAATALRGEQIDHILSSPYLRALQTAQPLAHVLGLPICVEHALAEWKHQPSLVPSAGSRVAFLPEVDDQLTPILGGDSFSIDPDTGSEPVLAYLRRMLLLAAQLPRRYPDSAIACFSHAASVALVGALTGCKVLRDAGRFAPCGIWKLVSEDSGISWRVEQRGDDNSGHVSENHPSTFPWGFEHASRSSDAHQHDWEQALSLGPLPVDAAVADSTSGKRQRKE